MAQLSPERIDEIRALEAEVTAHAHARADAKREAGTMTPETEAALSDRNVRTFFHGKITRTGTSSPIDEVVRWSKTAHGGHQFTLIDDAPEGCVRWGLCEPARSALGGETKGKDNV